MPSSDSGSSDDDSSSEDEVKVCDCERCYEGSKETCRECGCSGCETDNACMYDSDAENDGCVHDIRYWENKAHANEDRANYLTVDVRKEVRKNVKIQMLCDNRLRTMKNERERMKASFKEKISLLEAEHKHEAESYKKRDSDWLERVSELLQEQYVKQDEIDKLNKQLSDTAAKLAGTAKKLARKRART